VPSLQSRPVGRLPRTCFSSPREFGPFRFGLAASARNPAALIIDAWPLTAGTIVVANPDAASGTGAVIAVDPGNGRQALLSRGDLFVDPSNVAFLADGRFVAP
jgi:hypothetical protein